MSPKLQRLSGKEVLSILSKFGFAVYSQRGSHVKLRRTLEFQFYSPHRGVRQKYWYCF
ncbi:MAG: type II toxin-antitoxin system HicA family toxin [Nitrospira sp.]|nr:type II toxin-antitoxin system HicA family toxin [Nitrospira sp.]